MRWGLFALLASSPAVARGAVVGDERETIECRARCGRLTGWVRRAGERVPLSGARILVVPADDRDGGGLSEPRWQRSATTNVKGRFVLRALPQGRVRLVVLVPGYQRLEQVVEITDNDTTNVLLFPRLSQDSDYRTVVVARNVRETAPARRMLSREELQAMPGTQGDPLRALQNLPGVARAPASAGLLVIRGAAPAQSRVFVGGHSIPRAFHLLSLSSIFPSEIIENLEFVPSNFDAAWGNATGGVVVAEFKRGRRDGVHGHASIDVAGAGAMMEGPVGRGSFVVGARRGYIDAVVAATDAVVQRITGDRQSTLRPAYYDYQAMLDYPVGAGRLGVRIFGAGDRLRGPVNDPSKLQLRSAFHRVDVPWTTERHRTNVRLIPSFRFETNRFNAWGDTRRRRRRDYIGSFRGEIEHRWSQRFLWLVGTDLSVDAFAVRNEIQRGFGDADNRDVDQGRGVESSVAVYTAARLTWGRFVWRPAVRANAFTVRSQRAFAIDPRTTFRINVTDAWQVDVGLGLYSQIRAVRQQEGLGLGQNIIIEGGEVSFPPIFARFDPEVSFSPADASAGVRRAVHASGGAHYTFGSGWRLGATAFLRDQNNGTPLVYQGRVLQTTSTSQSYGVELLLRKRLTGNLFGWIGYTWMRAKVKYQTSGRPTIVRPSDFDQRHNLIILANYRLPRSWRIGGRFRYTSGYPFTPVIGSINAEGGRIVPLYGVRNARRFPAFHQLDLRVDKRWVRPRVSLTAYLEIQNVYNAKNAEAVIYGPDFRETLGVVGVPIFPLIGFRIDY